MRNLVVVVVVVTLFSSCKSEEEKQRELEALKSEVKAELAADAAKAEAERKAAEERAAAEAKAAEERAAAEAKAKEEEAKRARAAALKDVQKNPTKHLVVESLSSANTGIVNDYREVRAMTVRNKSQFVVSGLEASVEYFNPTGQSLGSIPVQLHEAMIQPGASQTFSWEKRNIASGKLRGNGTTYKVKFTKAFAWDPNDPANSDID